MFLHFVTPDIVLTDNMSDEYSPNMITWSVYHLSKKPKIPVGNSNGTAHCPGKFPKKMEILRRIPRNDRKIPVAFGNSHSTRFTSAPFPAFRHADAAAILIWYCFLPTARDSGYSGFSPLLKH